MTISGEVPTGKTVTIQLASGFNMVANPYPGAVAIATFGVLSNDMAGFNDDGDFATTMRVWNGNGYTTYGWSGTSGTDVLDDASFDNQWLDLGLNKVTGTIPFGTAVWILADKAGSITFTNPVE